MSVECEDCGEEYEPKDSEYIFLCQECGEIADEEAEADEDEW